MRNVVKYNIEELKIDSQTMSYFIYISIKQFIYSMKNKRIISDSEICLLCCFLISLWPFVPTGNFFNNFNSIIYFLPIGFYLSTRHKK